MPTVSDVFGQLGLVKWWKNPTQYFGFNGELGTDFGLGGTGLPVGAITGGQVIYAQLPPEYSQPGHSSIGYVVQVLSPDGYVYHYQHLKAASVHVGDTIGAGNVIGTSGGCAAGNYGATGSACIGGNQDAWSTGAHIEVRRAKYDKGKGLWSQPWIDPYTAFLQLSASDSKKPAPVAGEGDFFSQTGIPAPPDFGSFIASIPGWGEKIAIFLFALLVVGFGGWLLFQKQVEAIGGKVFNAGEAAATGGVSEVA